MKRIFFLMLCTLLLISFAMIPMGVQWVLEDYSETEVYSETEDDSEDEDYSEDEDDPDAEDDEDYPDYDDDEDYEDIRLPDEYCFGESDGYGSVLLGSLDLKPGAYNLKQLAPNVASCYGYGDSGGYGSIDY